MKQFWVSSNNVSTDRKGAVTGSGKSENNERLYSCRASQASCDAVTHDMDISNHTFTTYQVGRRGPEQHQTGQQIKAMPGE